MATTTFSPAGLQGPSALSTLIAKVRAYFAERRAVAQVLAELRTMDDRELNELNISRYDLRAIALETVRSR